MTVTLDIRLKRASKVYQEGETVVGTVVVSSPGEVRHDGLFLTVDGIANLELSSKSIGQFEAFYNSVKPVQLIKTSFPLCKAGKFPPRTTEIPFSFPVQGYAGRPLFETYHGVFINIQYVVRADLKRGMLMKDLEKTCTIVVECQSPVIGEGLPSGPKPVDFVIIPESVHKLSRSKYLMPNFKITGKLDSVVCDITKPFTGEVCIESSDSAIKSIEVQLVRVETCGCAEGYSKDVTEVQNIQIGDGDVMRDVAIPIYMIFPRLFTCPTLSTANFKIEFQVNVTVIFQDNHLVSENFPIHIVRF